MVASVVLTVAFFSDPFFVKFFPRSALGAAALFSFFCDEVGFRRRTGEVHVRDGVVALVGHAPHHLMPTSELSQVTRTLIALMPPAERAAWTSVDRLQSHQGAAVGYYLSAVSTVPWLRGQGRATRFMQEVFARKKPVLLETARESVRDWYIRLGMVTVDEYSLGDERSQVWTLLYSP